jgi:hypothetical protein
MTLEDELISGAGLDVLRQFLASIRDRIHVTLRLHIPRL